MGIVLLSLAGLGGLLLVFAILRDFRFLLVVVGLMLLTASSGIPMFEKYRYYANWFASVGAYRTGIYFGLSAMLLLGMAAHITRLNTRSIPFYGLVLLMIGIYAGTLRIMHETFLTGAGSIALALMAILPLIITVAALARDGQEAMRVPRMVFWVGVVWLGANAIQLLVGRKMAWSTAGSGQALRFQGITNNPQATALVLATLAGVCLWLFFNLRRGLERWMVVAVFFACLVLLVLTGSRTGMLLFLIIATAVGYRRLGRAILFVPFLVLAVYGVYWVAKNMGQGKTTLDRIGSFQDTRSFSWNKLWDTGVQNPIFGVGVTGAEVSENSYLYGFASYGIVMAALLVLQTLATVAFMLRLWRARSSLSPQSQHLVDLTIGFNAAYFAGALLEGYMIARIAAMTTLFAIFAGLAGALLRQAQSAEQLAAAGDEPADLEAPNPYARAEEEYGDGPPQPAPGGAA